MSAPVTPTTKELSDNIVAQISAQLSQSVPLAPKTFIRVLARAMAAAYVVLYKYGSFIWLQMFVRTASDKAFTVNGTLVTPLREWGSLVGIPAPTAATQAQLQVDVTVTTLGGFLRSGAQLLGASNGVVYTVSGDAALTSAIVSVVVRASGDQQGGDGSGVIGNLDVGASLSFASPLPNVGRVVTVTSQVVTGADGEATASYRQRVLDRFQKRAQGGAYADYEQWGEEVAGIANVYPYTSAQPGQVDVFVEATVASSGSPDGIPTTAQLLAVFNSIELDSAGLATRRPANALVNVFSITRLGFDVEVSGLVVDNPAAVQPQITEAVTEYFLNAAPFIPGLSIPPRLDIISQSALAGKVSDVVVSAGGVFSSVAVRDAAGLPGGLYALGQGEKAKAATVVFL